ncbi:hypothetical protein AB0E69_26025 [Kribbella sp. NPDC026611]|uniref:hypothetical protein n=1 Tax=Kribbella sp. NPDC026611 TaxID=3154911 RepID=UPI0033FDF86A
MITRPPERDLPADILERQAAELAAIVQHETAGRPSARSWRTYVVPLMAAAAVITVAAGLLVGVPALLKHQAEVPAAAKPTAAPIRTISQARAHRLALQCLRMRLPDKVTVLDAFEFTDVPLGSPHIKTWVILQGAKNVHVCGWDNKYGAAGDPTLTYDDRTYLYSVVEQVSPAVGRYTKPVAKVVVQLPGGQPVEALLRNGYWYTPLMDETRPTAFELDGYRGYTTFDVNAYDANGKLVYTTERDRVSALRCLTNSTATKVLEYGRDSHPDPKTCVRVIPWTH